MKQKGESGGGAMVNSLGSGGVGMVWCGRLCCWPKAKAELCWGGHWRELGCGGHLVSLWRELCWGGHLIGLWRELGSGGCLVGFWRDCGYGGHLIGHGRGLCWRGHLVGFWREHGCESQVIVFWRELYWGGHIIIFWREILSWNEGWDGCKYCILFERQADKCKMWIKIWNQYTGRDQATAMVGIIQNTKTREQNEIENWRITTQNRMARNRQAGKHWTILCPEHWNMRH